MPRFEELRRDPLRHERTTGPIHRPRPMSDRRRGRPKWPGSPQQRRPHRLPARRTAASTAGVISRGEARMRRWLDDGVLVRDGAALYRTAGLHRRPRAPAPHHGGDRRVGWRHRARAMCCTTSGRPEGPLDRLVSSGPRGPTVADLVRSRDAGCQALSRGEPLAAWTDDAGRSRLGGLREPQTSTPSGPPSRYPARVIAPATPRYERRSPTGTARARLRASRPHAGFGRAVEDELDVEPVHRSSPELLTAPTCCRLAATSASGPSMADASIIDRMARQGTLALVLPDGSGCSTRSRRWRPGRRIDTRWSTWPGRLPRTGSLQPGLARVAAGTPGGPGRVPGRAQQSPRSRRGPTARRMPPRPHFWPSPARLVFRSLT